MFDMLPLKTQFRATGWLEGGSLLILLLIAMPLKYMAGKPEYVQAVGMAHGALFIYYCLLAMYMAYKYDWSIKKLSLCWVLSCVPFGTFYFDKKLLEPKA